MRHKSLRRVGRSLAVSVLLAIAGVYASAYPEAQGPGRPGSLDPLISPQDRALCLGAAGATTARQLRTGAVRFVGTRAGEPIPHPRHPGAAASPEAAARAYLDACGSLFGLSDQSAELTLMRSLAAPGGRRVVRFQQALEGIPIIGAELIVHLDSVQNIVAVTGEMLPRSTTPSTRPAIDASIAMQTAVEVAAKTHDLNPSELETTPPELWVYAPQLITPFDGQPALVWRMDVTPSTLLPVRELVLVDAARGSVPLHFNQAETAKNRETYTANNTQTLPGTLVCNESDPMCAGGDADAAAAHIYAGDTYDFYFANHGRDSLDGVGMTLRSTVHYGPTDYRNAFWNGSQMAYGNGFAQSDDVVGHELTHGVTQFTSSLFYYYQSGAINESFSDLWGEFIDLTNTRGLDTPEVRWLLGEDIPPAGGAIRNMKDPAALGQPDKMTSSFYYIGSGDNGGVHFNSGINNKAAYLLSDGGTFNGQTIAPLGIPKTAKIYYEAQTHLLTSGSDYADLQSALIQACANLVGTSGITSGDCQQVGNATVAVEMHLQPRPDFNTDAALCLTGQALQTVFFDNLENGSGNFAFGAITGSQRWQPMPGFAHSGLTSLFGNDFPQAVADSFAALANGVVIPSGAYLHFAHAYGFEAPNFDGGVVEYSTNGGSTWTDAGSLFEINGYDGAISAARNNPLAGRSAFLGESHGYISSRLNLASLAGQIVRFRWRLAVDSTIFHLGWLVDDVRVYTCGGPRIVAVAPAEGQRGQTNLQVSMTGSETHFAQGQTTATFGEGVVVNGVTVLDSTHAVASISIDPVATLGLHDVLVTTGSEVAMMPAAFTVTKGALLRQVVPERGQPGANLRVVVKGQFTHFAQGATTANFGAGITINSLTVHDASRATADLTIASNAALGSRTVTMTTGAESVTLPGGFAIVSTIEDAHVLAYVLGKRLSPGQGGTDGAQRVTVVDLTTNTTLTTFLAGQGCSCVGSDGLVMTPDRSTVYVANQNEESVSIIRTATNTVVGTLPALGSAEALALSPSGDRLYIVHGYPAMVVSVVDTATDAVVATIPLGVPQSLGLSVSPDGSRLYVTTYGSDSVKVINTATNSIVGTVPVGSVPMGSGVSRNGAFVYALNSLGSSVSVINAATNTVATTVPVGTYPSSVKFSLDGARAFVANSGASPISVINAATHAPAGSVPLQGANALEFSADGSKLYAVTYGSLVTINPATLAVVGSIPHASGAFGTPFSLAVTAGPARILSLTGSLGFGEVHVGAVRSATLTVTNTGDSPLTVSGLSYPAGFSGNWAGGVLPPGGYQNVLVTFAPTAGVNYNGVITVNANTTAGASTVPVSGIGSLDSTRDGDFDGDGKTELVVYRPSEGRWYLLKSVGGFTVQSVLLWGVSTDVPVPGDYDGDGKTDVAVYRPSSGHWFVLKSSSGFTTWMTLLWGAGADIPVPGDYDGDNETDAAIYRPSTGEWFVLQSSTDFTTYGMYNWGVSGDVPVPGDYDGDGRYDLAVRRASGHWFLRFSSTSFATYNTYLWGAAGDIIVPGDYDGDRKIDPAAFRPSTGEWFILQSSSNYASWALHRWGVNGDRPMVGDYDGDGKADITVFRPASGHWFVLKSSTGYTTFTTMLWGVNGDIPLPQRP